jgi:hypothetical protein
MLQIIRRKVIKKWVEEMIEQSDIMLELSRVSTPHKYQIEDPINKII